MVSLHYFQDSAAFCFLVLIKAFVIYSPMGFHNLNFQVNGMNSPQFQALHVRRWT